HRRRSVADEFGLENGAEQLNGFFRSVRLQKYENSLLVTEAWPMVAYLLSAGGKMATVFTQERVGKLEAFLNNLLEQQKSIHITKETGIFIARK
ncbi:MAG: hypothetical protein WCP73_04135, partial [Eubacteriales bacterium]